MKSSGYSEEDYNSVRESDSSKQSLKEDSFISEEQSEDSKLEEQSYKYLNIELYSSHHGFEGVMAVLDKPSEAIN